MGGHSPPSLFLKPGVLPTSEAPAQGQDQGRPQTGQHGWWCEEGPAGPGGSEAGRSRVPQHWKGCEAPGPALERGDSSGPRGTPPLPPPDSPSQLRQVDVSRRHLLGSPCSRRPVPFSGRRPGDPGQSEWASHLECMCGHAWTCVDMRGTCTGLGADTSVDNTCCLGHPCIYIIAEGYVPDCMCADLSATLMHVSCMQDHVNTHLCVHS